MSTRRSFLGKSLFIGAAGVPAIAAALKTSLAGAQDAEVLVWTWRAPDEAVWAEVQEALQADVPGLTIKVEVHQATEYATIVSTAMQAGEGPDIITTRAGEAYFRPFADASMFVPLTDDVPGLADIPATTLDQVSYNDQVLAIPFASQVWLAYYNTKIFAEHGLKPPTTHAEFLTLCQALKDAGEVPLFIPHRDGWVLSGWMDFFGATYLGEDYVAELIAGTKRFTDEKFVSLLQRVKDLVPFFQDQFVGNNAEDMDAAFQRGDAAMIIYGGWAANTYHTTTPDLEFDFFLAPPDDASGKAASYVFADGGYAINSASSVKDAALEVIKFSATPEYGTIFAANTQEMSSIPGFTAPAENFFLERQIELAGSAITNLFRIRSVFENGDPGISVLLHPLMQGMLSDEISPEDVAKQLDEGLSQWYEPFKG